MHPWLWVVAGAALAGCASPSIESARFDSGGAIETAIKRHYSSNASERHGLCPRPYIDGITGVEVIEDSPERLVAEVRYFFRDRIREQAGDEDDGAVFCTGFSERTFTVTSTDQGPKVTDMSGPQEEPYLRARFKEMFQERSSHGRGGPRRARTAGARNAARPTAMDDAGHAVCPPR